MGKSGNVEAIRKCGALEKGFWIDGKVDGVREWRRRRRCISMFLELIEYCMHCREDLFGDTDFDFWELLH